MQIKFGISILKHQLSHTTRKTFYLLTSMNQSLHPQYITDERGNRVSVVLPIEQWQQMLDELEELDDIRLYDEVKARNEPTISLAEYRKKRQRANG